MIAASLVLAFFIMPSASHAFEPVYCEGCENGPPTQPGCNGLQSDRSGGNMSRWVVYANGGNANYTMDYSLTAPGTWTISYHLDIYDDRGVKVGNVDLSGGEIYVPPDSTWSGTVNGNIPNAPTGGTVQMTVDAISDIGGYIEGWGQTQNLGCGVVL